MKALVLVGPKQLELRDVSDPAAEGSDVVVRVRACGICGSDVHGADGSTGRRRPPIVMGHEAAGVIEAVGPATAGWQCGDRVTFDSTIYCGSCHDCRRGAINLCDNRRVLGVSCAEYRQDGAMAELVRVPQHILYRLPDGLSFEEAAMVEPLSVAVHAVGRAGACLGRTAVVVGTGVIGLLVVQTLRAAGCGRIIAVDIDPGRLELSRSLGADVALNPGRDDIDSVVAGQTNGRGADLAFEVVGATATLRTAVDSLRKGGRLMLIGNVSPTVEAPLQSLVTREITVLGSCASCGEYPVCLDLMASGKIDVRPLISEAVPLADGPMCFDRLYDRRPGLVKVILQPT